MITYSCDNCKRPIDGLDEIARHVVVGLMEMPDRKSRPDFKNAYKPAEDTSRDYCGACVQIFKMNGWKFKGQT